MDSYRVFFFNWVSLPRFRPYLVCEELIKIGGRNGAGPFHESSFERTQKLRSTQEKPLSNHEPRWTRFYRVFFLPSFGWAKRLRSPPPRRLFSHSQRLLSICLINFSFDQQQQTFAEFIGFPLNFRYNEYLIWFRLISYNIIIKTSVNLLCSWFNLVNFLLLILKQTNLGQASSKHGILVSAGALFLASRGIVLIELPLGVWINEETRSRASFSRHRFMSLQAAVSFVWRSFEKKVGQYFISLTDWKSPPCTLLPPPFTRNYLKKNEKKRFKRRGSEPDRWTPERQLKNDDDDGGHHDNHDDRHDNDNGGDDDGGFRPLSLSLSLSWGDLRTIACRTVASRTRSPSVQLLFFGANFSKKK